VYWTGRVCPVAGAREDPSSRVNVTAPSPVTVPQRGACQRLGLAPAG
jgi:hypothetical protein